MKSSVAHARACIKPGRCGLLRSYKSDELVDEDERSNQSRKQAGHQHTARCHVERGPGPLLRLRVESPEERLERAVKELGRQNEGDAAQQNTPLPQFALENDGSSGNQDSEEEVNRETGLSANAKLQPTECRTKLR